MKRSTKSNVGVYPNMRIETLKEISAELIRARKKHPDTGCPIYLLDYYSKQLAEALENHRRDRMPATHVFTVAATLAAMAIRVMEDGSPGYPYARRGYEKPFELTGD